MSDSNGVLIRLDGVSKVFYTDEVETHALADIHLQVAKGEYLAIAGPSGGGKSTLLSILGLLDTPTGGLLDAVEFGRLERVRELLAEDDPDQDVGGGGRGALLRMASFTGNEELVKLLLERGADPSLCNSQGRTALSWASEQGHDGIVLLLQAHGAKD